MPDLMRTTIVFPEDLLKLAKLKALDEGKSLSALIREATEEKLIGKKPKTKKLELGKYSLGIRDSLSRKEIYGQYFKKRISD